MEKERRHPWRVGGTKDDWRLTKPVARNLAHLARFKLVRKTYFDAFMPDRHGKGQGATLGRMVDAGLIYKPIEQKEGQYSLGYPHIYALTKEGEKIVHSELAQRDPNDPTKIKRVKIAAHYFKGGDDFKHDIATSDILQSIALGAGDRFVSWQELLENAPSKDPFKWDYDFTYKGVRYKGTINADGFFGIRHEQGIMVHPLETERTGVGNRTDPKQSSRVKKALIYDYLDDHKIIQNKLGVKAFRVLFAVMNDEMARHTLEDFDEIFGRTDLLAVKRVPMQNYHLPKTPPPFPEIFTDPWETPAGLRWLNKV